MEAQIRNMRGLAKVIFEEMVYASELVPDPSALWTQENFERLHDGLRERLAPQNGDSSDSFFNMIFDRSFAQAKSVFEDMIHLAMPPMEKSHIQPMFAMA